MVSPADLDLVYIVRPGENEELRYSLRSVAANFPHRRVWIFGHCPAWVRGVHAVELPPRSEKFANQRASLRAACADDRLSDWFVLFNDDMFVTQPVTDLDVYHLGPLAALAAAEPATEPESWGAGLAATLEQMRAWGHVEPLAYEAHVPLPFNRRELAYLLDRAEWHPFLWGSAYSATSGPVGELGCNTKVADLGARDVLTVMSSGMPYLSTEDEAFSAGLVGNWLRSQFATPCMYEEA